MLAQKLISEMESSDKKTSLSQEKAEFATEERCLVKIRVTDPTQEESEIMWPTTLETLLTGTLQRDCWKHNVYNDPRSEVNFVMRSSMA